MSLLRQSALLPFLLISLSGVHSAHAHAHQRLPRQDTASSSSIPDPAAGASSTAIASATSSSPETYSFSLASTNPTAIPITQIIQSPSAEATVPLPTTYAAGSNAPISGAPSLPNFNQLNPANYPALDVVPPTNSPEVQAWIAQVKASGIDIPGFSATQDGGCASNPDLVADKSRCWWTCGQCTRDTDITVCPDKLTWGLSFDDGPSPDTPRLLNYLAEQKIHSTFFVVGSRAISRPEMLQAEYMGGHQLSIHTWSHTPLTTQTNEEIIAELGWTAKVIKDITGVTPNTMRPPYGDIDDRVRAIALAMGFRPIIWTSVGEENFDTNDWHIGGGQVSASGVISQFQEILDQASDIDTGFIVLAHDLYQQSVDLAVGYILPDALARTNPKYNLMSISECLKLPLENAYIETNNNSTNPPPNDVNDDGDDGDDNSSGGGSNNQNDTSNNSTSNNSTSTGSTAPSAQAWGVWSLTAATVTCIILGSIMTA